MPKFKNKKTGKIVEEKLLYYVEKYRNDSNYEEVVDKKQEKPVTNNKKEVEEKPLH